MLTLESFIGGHWESGDTDRVVVVRNPATEEVIAQTTEPSDEQVARAIQAARARFDASGINHEPQVAARHLMAIAEQWDKRRDALVDLIVEDVGSPINFAPSGQVDAAIRQLEWYAWAADKLPLEEALAPLTAARGSQGVIRWEPAGVVTAITPFNFPLLVLAWKLGAALATGCTCVVMPSLLAPTSITEAFRAIEEAALPEGTCNLVLGGPTAGKLLSESPDVDVVSFTGSVEVGALVMRQASPTVKKTVLELGGKSAAILLPGENAEAFVAQVMPRLCRTAGQACAALTRVLVHHDALERVLDLCAKKVESMSVGDPGNPETDMGPLISEQARHRVEMALERAVSAGADIVAGGGRPARLLRGYFVNPAVVTGLPTSAELACEEVFGPVLTVLPYADIDEAVAISNSTKFGLSSNVWGPKDAALSVARRLRDGTVTLGAAPGIRPDAPWGGFKLSGVGRERGFAGMREFQEAKHIEWPLDA